MIQVAWAIVDNKLPWNDWWPDFLQHMKWPKDLALERWNSDSPQWSRLMDSALCFTLFAKKKILVVSDAERWFKGQSEAASMLEDLQRAPHFVVFCSESSPDKKLKISTWSAPQTETVSEDKAAFRWIDFLHQKKLTEALLELDSALQSGQSAFGLLQLLNRDFRLGRLIHYARETHIKEDEVAKILKIPSFAVRKWLSRPQRTKAQWSRVFDRLLLADLELKSAHDPQWALRRLSLDLVSPKQILDRPELRKQQISRPPMQLWPSEPSFA